MRGSARLWASHLLLARGCILLLLHDLQLAAAMTFVIFLCFGFRYLNNRKMVTFLQDQGKMVMVRSVLSCRRRLLPSATF